MKNKITYTNAGINFKQETKKEILMDVLDKKIKNQENKNENQSSINNFITFSNIIQQKTNSNKVPNFLNVSQKQSYVGSVRASFNKLTSNILQSFNEKRDSNALTLCAQKQQTETNYDTNKPFLKLQKFLSQNTSPKSSPIKNNKKNISYSQHLNKLPFPESFQGSLLSGELVRSFYKPMPLKESVADHYKKQKQSRLNKSENISGVKDSRTQSFTYTMMRSNSRLGSSHTRTSNLSPQKLMQKQFNFSQCDSILDQKNIEVTNSKQDQEFNKSYNDRLVEYNEQKQKKYQETIKNNIKYHVMRQEEQHDSCITESIKFWKKFKDQSSQYNKLQRNINKHKYREFLRMSQELHKTQVNYHSKLYNNYKVIQGKKIQIKSYENPVNPSDVSKRLQDKYRLKQIDQNIIEDKSDKLFSLVQIINRSKQKIRQIRGRKNQQLQEEKLKKEMEENKQGKVKTSSFHFPNQQI